MDIQISRKLIALLVVAVVFVTGVVAAVPLVGQGRLSAPISDSEIVTSAREIAIAFGKGDLYQHPESYPVTERFIESVNDLPNKATVWPEYVGLAGDVLIVLRGKDGTSQDFVDVTAHVLNKSMGGSSLTQVVLRFVKDSNSWKVDRLFSIPKGDFKS